MNLKKSLTKRLGPVVFPFRVRHLHGAKRIATGPLDLVVVSLMRDAARHIATFIEHHLALGAAHIVLLDNGSQDDTVAIARRYRCVTVLASRASFRYHENIMRRYLIRRFAPQRWCLYADIDECFDYPVSERLPLPQFLAYLNHYGYTAVVAQMLDMFADRPLGGQPNHSADLRADYPLYDLSAIEHRPFPVGDGNIRRDDHIMRLYGGIRKTFLGVTVLLTKHPLLFNDGRLRPFAARSAAAHAVQGARIADVSCVLRHYKLIDGFYDQAQEVARSQRYGDGDTRDYKSYLQAMTGEHARPSPAGDAAQQYSGTEALIQQDFLVVSEAYRQWVARSA